MNKHQGKLFIVSGPSGVGKTTVVSCFLKRYQHLYNAHRVVTYTTKQPRNTEVDGIDYHFITEFDFQQKIESGFFLEWSGEYGALYGTPISVLQDLVSGISKILIIDRVGASQIISKYPGAILVWITVSSDDLLLKRLISRKTESLEQVQLRFSLAQKEIELERKNSMYDYYVQNDDLDAAVLNFYNIVVRCCIVNC